MDYDLEHLQQLVSRHAPVFHLHPSDQFMPCSVEFFMDHSTLVQLSGVSGQSPKVLLPLGAVSAEALLEQQALRPPPAQLRLELEKSARAGFPVVSGSAWLECMECLNACGNVAAGAWATRIFIMGVLQSMPGTHEEQVDVSAHFVIKHNWPIHNRDVLPGRPWTIALLGRLTPHAMSGYGLSAVYLRAVLDHLYLQFIRVSRMRMQDKINDVPLYAHVKEITTLPDASGYSSVEALEINYLTFYAYNGPYNVGGVRLIQTGAHDGDWEHITARCPLPLHARTPQQGWGLPSLLCCIFEIRCKSALILKFASSRG